MRVDIVRRDHARFPVLAFELLSNSEIKKFRQRRYTCRSRRPGDVDRRVYSQHAHSALLEKSEQRAIVAPDFDDEPSLGSRISLERPRCIPSIMLDQSEAARRTVDVIPK